MSREMGSLVSRSFELDSVENLFYALKKFGKL